MTREFIGLARAAGGAHRFVAFVGGAAVERVQEGREGKIGAAGEIVVPAFEIEPQQHHHERNREEHQGEADPGGTAVGLGQRLGFGSERRRLPLQGLEVFGLVGAHSRSLLPMLQAEHRVWRLSKVVAPPLAHGVM